MLSRQKTFEEFIGEAERAAVGRLMLYAFPHPGYRWKLILTGVRRDGVLLCYDEMADGLQERLESFRLALSALGFRPRSERTVLNPCFFELQSLLN